jgi:hypothetical protein
LASEASCDQKDARTLQQRLDDKSEPVVAKSQAPVLKHPGIAALDRPAPLAQSRSVRLSTLVDARLGPEAAAQPAMTLGVVALAGEHRSNPSHDRKGGQDRRSKTSVSLMLGAAATHATITPSPVIAI